MRPREVAGQLIRQLGHSITAAVFNALWSVAMAIAAARRLDDDDFGRFTLVLSVQNLLAALVNSAVGQAAIKHVAELAGLDRDQLRRVVATLTVITAGLSLLTALAFVFGGEKIRAAALGPDPPSGPVPVTAIVMLMTGVLTFQQGLLSGFGAFGSVAVTNAARLIIGLAVLLLGPATLSGAISAVAAGLAAAIVCAHLLGHSAHRHQTSPIPWREWTHQLPIVWTFAVPSLLTGALFALAAWVANLIVANQTDGLIEVARFNAASQWGRSLLLFVPNAIAAPLLVRMAAQWSAGDLHALHRTTRRGIALSLAATIAPCILVLLFGRYLLAWYGPSYVEALPTLRILLLSTSAASFTVVTNVALAATGRMWFVAAICATWTAVFLTMVALRPDAGAEGLAWAYLVSYGIQALLTIAALRVALRSP